MLSRAAGQVGVMAKVSLPAPATAATTFQRTDQSVADLVVATEEQLFVFSWDSGQSRYRERVRFEQFPAPISAVAAWPDADGQTIFLWVGMKGSGSVQLYTLQNHQLTLITTAGRLWSNVRQLLVFDANGDGHPDVMARSDAGIAALFLSDGGRYTEVWRTAADDAPDAWLAVGHVIDSELPTIVIGKDDGQFSLYRWARPLTPATESPGTLRKQYDNFPWGRLQALHTWSPTAPEPTDGDDDLPLHAPDDVYVISSQGWVYQYAWLQDQSRLEQQWPHTLGEDVKDLQLLVNDGAALPAWVGIQADGLRAFNLDASALHEGWHIPGTYAWVTTTPSGLVIAASVEENVSDHTPGASVNGTHGVLVIGPVDDDFVRIERRGRPVTLTTKPLIEDGHVFISLADMTSLLGLRVWTAHGGTRIFGLAPLFQFYVVDVGSNTVMVNGTTKPLAAPARVVEGVIYLPASFAAAVGVTYDWDDMTRTLAFK